MLKRYQKYITFLPIILLLCTSMLSLYYQELKKQKENYQFQNEVSKWKLTEKGQETLLNSSLDQLKQQYMDLKIERSLLEDSYQTLLEKITSLQKEIASIEGEES